MLGSRGGAAERGEEAGASGAAAVPALSLGRRGRSNQAQAASLSVTLTGQQVPVETESLSDGPREAWRLWLSLLPKGCYTHTGDSARAGRNRGHRHPDGVTLMAPPAPAAA